MIEGYSQRRSADGVALGAIKAGRGTPISPAGLTYDEWRVCSIRKTAQLAEALCGSSLLMIGPYLAAEAVVLRLKRLDVNSPQALVPLLNVELDALVLTKRVKAFAFDSRMMNEYIISGLAGDEAIAFSIVEPLNRTCLFLRHLLFTP
jgi:hypothetical protein